MKYVIETQGYPFEVPGTRVKVVDARGKSHFESEWAANIQQVGSVEASSPSEAIRMAKAEGLSLHPIVYPEVDWSSFIAANGIEGE